MTAPAAHHPRHFTAATWNVYNETPSATLEPVLDRLLNRDGVSLLYGQEMIQQEVRHMLRDAGLVVAFAAPQYVVAWDPDTWDADGHAEHVHLAVTPYYTTKGHPMHVDGVLQHLTHARTEKHLAALSYHLPSHVQVADQPANRIQATREAAHTFRVLSRHALGQDGADAALFAGDDNVDERLSHGPWRFLLRAGTGMRQVQAPRGTHGSRRIDDYRIRGDLRPLDGHTVPVPAPDDHDVHVRTFAWR